uniref:Late embryogenesis abundant protein LEA-2 subgroup domain-containing protein n=1 Tax=Salix viminalis TaxID=40686 RepID=A0A6N2KSU5_SALVM
MSPPSHLPSTTKNSKSDAAKAKAQECVVLLLFITVATILIVSVPFIARGIISLQPQIPLFNVSSSLLTILNVSSTTITANLNVTFSVKNPNSKTMSYYKITAWCSIRMKASDSYSSGGRVNLTMKLHAKVKYGRWTWPAHKDLMKATCDENVKVEFPSKRFKFSQSILKGEIRISAVLHFWG